MWNKSHLSRFHIFFFDNIRSITFDKVSADYASCSKTILNIFLLLYTPQYSLIFLVLILCFILFLNIKFPLAMPCVCICRCRLLVVDFLFLFFFSPTHIRELLQRCLIQLYFLQL